MPRGLQGRSEVFQWLVQINGIGPMQGRATVFDRHLEPKVSVVEQRYRNETARVSTVQ